MSTMSSMAPRVRSIDRAVDRTLRDLTALGQDLRTARLAAGLTQAQVGHHAGISSRQEGRLERGRMQRFDASTVSRGLAAVGLELRIRAYPAGNPIRDAGHVALLGRFRGRVSPAWRWRVEVPVGAVPDGRAWDAVATCNGLRVAVEAETRLYDIQAQLRRILAKAGADRVDRLILVVAATHANRRVIRDVRELMRDDFPLDTRSVLAALGAGRDPGANGIVMV
jgi:transcriptional regulator with XRE-family HTH domain